MTTSPPNPNPLGAFAGLIGILSIFLFFTGWVYRWAYFGFFEIELNNLNFPIQSFLIVPIQVVLGDLDKLVLAILITCVVFVSIVGIFRVFDSIHSIPIVQKKQWLKNLCDRMQRLNDLFPQNLLRDLMVVGGILAALFWFARFQGTEDARRDAIDRSSTRPIVTLVSPSDKFTLGASLNDELVGNSEKNPVYPKLEKVQIFGDVEQFRKIHGRSINRDDKSEPIVWRLLIESGNWLYIYPSLSAQQENSRPLVLAVNTGDGRVQSLILSRPKKDKS